MAFRMFTPAVYITFMLFVLCVHARYHHHHHHRHHQHHKHSHPTSEISMPPSFSPEIEAPAPSVSSEYEPPVPPPSMVEAPVPSLPPEAEAPDVEPPAPSLPPEGVAPDVDAPAPSPDINWDNYTGDYDVRMFGAVGDGVTDDTEAFKTAWDTACQTDSGVLLAPYGYTFMVQSTIFTGPCQTGFVFQVTFSFLLVFFEFMFSGKTKNENLCWTWTF